MQYHFLTLLAFVILTPSILVADDTIAASCNDMLLFYQLALLLISIFMAILFYSYIKLLKKSRALEASEDDLITITYFDPLTELPNKLHIETIVADQILRCQRHDRPFHVAYLSITNFDDLCSTYDKKIIDALLSELADRFYHTIRREDMLGSIDSNAFVIIFNEYFDTTYLDLIFTRIHDILDKPFMFDNTQIRCQIAIGIASYPDHSISANELISHAQSAAHHNATTNTLYTFYA